MSSYRLTPANWQVPMLEHPIHIDAIEECILARPEVAHVLCRVVYRQGVPKHYPIMDDGVDVSGCYGISCSDCVLLDTNRVNTALSRGDIRITEFITD